MHIGIIVFSQTGHTKSVTEKLAARLKERGHDVTIEEVKPEGEVTPATKNITFISAPEVSPYEGIVFASPVQAFSLASGMKAYMGRIGSLEKKRVACFVTKQIPAKWTGGNKALRQMKKLCTLSGAAPAVTGIIFWGDKYRERMIDETVEAITGAF